MPVYMKLKIVDFSAYKPSEVISNKELENKINADSTLVPSGMIEKIFGIKQRRFAGENEQVSDLATKAAQPLLEKYDPKSIDLLIFASASSDLIEPATSNIIQHKLGLDCPVMDIKNACNSFVSALQVSSGLISTGQYKNILLVTGEKLSDGIRYSFEDQKQLKNSFAAFSFGDAGSATLLSYSENGSSIPYQKFMSDGKFWELCTVKGGGSLHPHEDKNYFEGHTAALRNTIIEHAESFIKNCFKEANILPSEIDHLFTHQVSMGIFKDVVEITEIPIEKCHIVFEEFGNTAASSIPLAMEKAKAKNELKRGQLILLIGMAAGISISFQLIRY